MLKQRIQLLHKERNDATHVARQPHFETVKRKAKPGYKLVSVNGKTLEVPEAAQVYTHPITKILYVAYPKQAELKLDNRSSYLKEQDLKETLRQHKLAEKAELDEATRLVSNLFAPSLHAGSVVRLVKGTDKAYFEDVVDGPGVVSEEFAQEHPDLSRAANFGFDLVAAPLITKGTSSALSWRPWIPRYSNRYYRIVGPSTISTGDAIADASLTGQLRSPAYVRSFDVSSTVGGDKAFRYMMFSKGKPWLGSTGVGMGVGSSDRVIVSNARTPGIVWEESNVDFGHKGHAGIFRPRYNGALDWVPADNFHYYERGPFGIGWMRREFGNTAAESMRAMDDMLDGAELPKLRQPFILRKGSVSRELYSEGARKAREHKFAPVRRYLQKYGIDDSKYSDEQLLYLLDLHRAALKKTALSYYPRHVIVDGDARVFENGFARGGATYGTNGDGLTIGMVRRSEDLGQGYKGISEDAYNGLILIAHDYFNLPGLVSGRQLLSPEITVNHVWPKFGRKVLIGDTGHWYWNHGRDVTKLGPEVDTYHNPIMLLLERSNTTPVKSPAMFDPRGISDGKFVINWKNGNPFMKQGGSIHIKDKNKGKFTASAKQSGLSVQEHAKSVLNDPNATPLQKKRANFARNAAKWKH